MRYALRSTFITICFIALFFSFSYCAEPRIEEIVDQFAQATEVQREELRNYYKDQDVLGYGLVDNVRKYNTFDEVNDIERNYFQIVTKVQQTIQGNPYKVVFLYRKLNKVKNIDKGQVIDRRGSILRIIDERLWISVWLYETELTSAEKAQFQFLRYE